MATKRIAHKTRQDVDLSKPLNAFEVAKVEDGKCFGRMWDPSTDECQSCADSEICGILKERAVKKMAKAVEDEKGPFLDLAAMHKVTDSHISELLTASPVQWTAEALVKELLRMARTSDRKSAIERIKRYKATGLIKIKSGIIEWQGE